MYQELLASQKQSLAKEVPELLPLTQAGEGTGGMYAMLVLMDSTENFRGQF